MAKQAAMSLPTTVSFNLGSNTKTPSPLKRGIFFFGESEQPFHAKGAEMKTQREYKLLNMQESREHREYKRHCIEEMQYFAARGTST